MGAGRLRNVVTHTGWTVLIVFVQIYEDVSSSAKSKKLPVKWMAPEALYQGLYTTKSDV